tara:strand:- start:28 stop:390 length:363 start_codon:yes stop_codon:yes gene_type:complete
MKINEFIENTIVEICQGIQMAKSNEINNNGAIAPHSITTPHGTKKDIYEVREIEFDLNIVISKENTLDMGGGGKVGIKLLGSVDTSVNKNISSVQQETQRIKFSVPFVAEAITIRSDGKC